MKILLTLIAFVSVCTGASGQDGYGSTSVYDRVATLPRGKHFFIIPPNKSWDQQVWKDSVYEFPQFQSGKVEMTNGFVPTNRPLLNYNVMFESIDIRQPTGEIVRMRKSPAIKQVWIGEHKFINDPAYGYLEVITEGKVTVVEKAYMDALYELSNGQRYPMRSLNDTKIPSNEATQYFWEERQLLLLDEKMRIFRPATGSLKRILPKLKNEIKSFSKSNHIDYKKKDDVMKIVGYLNQL